MSCVGPSKSPWRALVLAALTLSTAVIQCRSRERPRDTQSKARFDAGTVAVFDQETEAPPFVVTNEPGLHGELVPGPSAGAVEAIAEDAGRIFAAPRPLGKGGGGVFRSDDGGLHFHRASTGLPRLSHGEGQAPAGAYAPVTALAAHGGVLLAGAQCEGIYRSLDGGNTWSLSPGLPVTSMQDLEHFGCGVSDIVFGKTRAHALAGSRILTSADGGLTWEGGTETASSLAGEGTLLCETLAGTVLVSEDEGVHFRATPVPGVHRVFVHRGIIYAAPFLAQDPIRMSRDRGRTFSAQRREWPGDQHAPLILAAFNLPLPTNAAQRPFEYSLWSTTAGTESTDGTIALATAFGLLLTHDHGASYEPSRDGLTVTPLPQVALTESQLLAAAEHGNLYASPHDGSDFRPNAYGGGEVRALVAHGAQVLAGDEQGRVFRSADEGRTWQPLAFPPATPEGPVEALAFNADHWFIVRGGLLLSHDGGLHYTDLRQGFPLAPRARREGGVEYRIGCAELGPHAVFVCGSTGVMRRGDGEAWTTVHPGGRIGLVKAIAVDGLATYAATATTLYRSVDDGRSFTVVGRPESELSIASIGAAEGELLVVADAYERSAGPPAKLLHSTDSGRSWRASTPDAGLVLRSLPRRGPRAWYVGLESDGFWRITP